MANNYRASSTSHLKMAFNMASIFILFLLNISSSYAVSNFANLLGAQKGDQRVGLVELKKYLSRFGYIKNNNTNNQLDENLNNDVFDEKLESALKLYQEFFSLPVTGKLDPLTLNGMGQPRCGVPDHPHSAKNASSKYTFFPGNPKWSKMSLTYSFPPGTRQDVRHPIQAALSQWAQVTRFQFTYTDNYNSADIKISFQVRNHGDGSPFDGAGGILAHAFAPTDGRLHYDGDETWIDGVQGGKFDLQTVGLHELGHVLGLGHTTDGNAVMYPTIGPGTRKGLGKDDIDGIHALYK